MDAIRSSAFVFLLFFYSVLAAQESDPLLDSLLEQSSSSDDLVKMQAYLSLADFYALKDSSKMLFYLQKVDQSGSFPDSTRRRLLYEKVDVLKKARRLDEAIRILKNELTVAEQQKNIAEQANIHKELSSCYFFMYDFDSTKSEVNAAANLYLQLGDSVNYGIMLLRTGNIHYLKGEYEQSIEYGIQAKNIFIAIGDNQQLAVAYLHVGNIFYLLKDYKNAGDFYSRSRSQFLKADDELGYARAIVNHGLVYMELEEYDRSLKLHYKALPVIHKEGRLSDLSLLYNFMAEAFLGMEEYDSTEIYLSKAIEIDNKIENRLGLSQNYLLLAKMNFKLEKIDPALEFAHKSLDFLEGIEARESEKLIYELLYQIYDKKEDYPNAFAYLSDYVRVTDSLAIDDITTRKKAMDERIKLEAANYELKLVNQKKDLILQENESQKQYLAGISIIALFAIIVVILLLRSNNKNRMLNINLKEKQDMITDDLKVKESLLKEIHHRVKNNLQIISSMLSIQDKHLNDARFAEIITECKNRINSMSLIHENLYKSEDLYEEYFSSYVRKLAHQLMNTYSIDETKIKLQLEMEDFYLGLDDSVPSGLIINEVVSNSIKHAFIDKDEGIIEIRLTKKGKIICLFISDNGKGMDSNVELKEAETFGLLLISLLASQLNAEVKVDTSNGTAYTFTWFQKEELLRLAV